VELVSNMRYGDGSISSWSC